MVETAVSNRGVSAPSATRVYLVDLLEHHMFTQNLGLVLEGEGGTKEATLAEVFLTATNAEPGIRAEMLKKLGDTSLYISGFFGDSLQRKLVDIDYYAGIGGTAYGTLATCTNEQQFVPVFTDLASRFLEYVDVLTYISQQSLIQTHEDLLRLYDRYLATGSELARTQLIEKGVLPSSTPGKVSKQ